MNWDWIWPVINIVGIMLLIGPMRVAREQERHGFFAFCLFLVSLQAALFVFNVLDAAGLY